jgi:hypothetical protein
MSVTPSPGTKGRLDRLTQLLTALDGGQQMHVSWAGNLTAVKLVSPLPASAYAASPEEKKTFSLAVRRASETVGGSQPPPVNVQPLPDTHLPTLNSHIPRGPLSVTSVKGVHPHPIASGRSSAGGSQLHDLGGGVLQPAPSSNQAHGSLTAFSRALRGCASNAQPMQQAAGLPLLNNFYSGEATSISTIVSDADLSTDRDAEHSVASEHDADQHACNDETSSAKPPALTRQSVDARLVRGAPAAWAAAPETAVRSSPVGTVRAAWAAAPETAVRSSPVGTVRAAWAAAPETVVRSSPVGTVRNLSKRSLGVLQPSLRSQHTTYDDAWVDVSSAMPAGPRPMVRPLPSACPPVLPPAPPPYPPLTPPRSPQTPPWRPAGPVRKSPSRGGSASPSPASPVQQQQLSRSSSHPGKQCASPSPSLNGSCEQSPLRDPSLPAIPSSLVPVSGRPAAAAAIRGILAGTFSSHPIAGRGQLEARTLESVAATAQLASQSPASGRSNSAAASRPPANDSASGIVSTKAPAFIPPPFQRRRITPLRDIQAQAGQPRENAGEKKPLARFSSRRPASAATRAAVKTAERLSESRPVARGRLSYDPNESIEQALLAAALLQELRNQDDRLTREVQQEKEAAAISPISRQRDSAVHTPRNMSRQLLGRMPPTSIGRRPSPLPPAQPAPTRHAASSRTPELRATHKLTSSSLASGRAGGGHSQSRATEIIDFMRGLVEVLEPNTPPSLAARNFRGTKARGSSQTARRPPTAVTRAGVKARVAWR